jgi:hypothetical protein
MNSIAYPCASVPEVPEGHYSRLCPGRWQPFDDALLHDLADNVMKDSKRKRDWRAKHDPLPTQPMPSGYVYFGQFIDHDITRDGRTLDQAGPDVEQTLNYRTPRLDLDLLYGKDPLTVPCIYEEDGERLKLGPTQPAKSKGRKLRSTFDDLPRQDGTAIVVDARSDENLVIAQMHVLFAKFHNRVLDLLRNKPELSLGPNGGSLFDQARRFVTWHYQWIIVKDFLPLIVREPILIDVRKQHFRLFRHVYTLAHCPMPLPVEFTMAAYRFGHSMVREQYFLNRDVNTQRSFELIHMTKRGGGIVKQLPATYVIDWDYFFFISSPVNIGQAIDTFITEMMYGLPEQAAKAFHFQSTFAAVSPARDSAQMSPALPETTLKRGSRARLPSGQEFARAFGYKLIDPEQIPALPEDKDFFEQSGLNMRTPLWYYLLREADLEARSDPGEGTETKAPIQKLGSIGSRIVAEVFYQLLHTDCESVLHAGKKRKPPEFVFGTSKKPRPILSLPDLIEFVQSA